MAKLKNIIQLNIIMPLLLSAALCGATFSAYGIEFCSKWNLVALMVCCLVFLFARVAKRNNLIGGIIIFLITIVITVLFARLIRSFDYGKSFLRWFLGGEIDDQNRLRYLLAMLIAFGYFFSIVVYYFTNIVYRASCLMLISIIPFALHVKILSDVNIYYVFIITFLNLSIFIFNMNGKVAKERLKIGYFPASLAVMFFMGIVFLLTFLIPKNNNAAYYKYFQEIFMNDEMETLVPTEFTDFNQYSGNADNYGKHTKRYMYSIVADTKEYYRRQTFDYYDYEKNVWYADNVYSVPSMSLDEYNSRSNELDIGNLCNAIKLACKIDSEFSQKYNLKAFLDMKINSEKVSKAYIQSWNFPSQVYLTTVGTFYVDCQNPTENVVTKSSIIKRNIGYNDLNEAYSLEYYPQNFIWNQWLYKGTANFDIENYRVFLSDLRRVLADDSEGYLTTINYFYNDYNEAIHYYETVKKSNSQIPESIVKLSNEITQDCKYDWEKAVKIENYFKNNGFVYDLDYKATDDSVEYFLFDSKRGTCSDFASAYVLLARSAGLIVRYTEGYVPNEIYGDGTQVITLDCGHAYPEVYIPNTGFTVFEPTIASNENQSIYGKAYNSVMKNKKKSATVAFMVLAGIVAFIAIIFLSKKLITKVIFGIKFLFYEPNKSVILMFDCLQMRFAQAVNVDDTTVKSYTPNEFAMVFYNSFGYDLSKMTSIIEKSVYSDVKLTKNDKFKMYKVFEEAMKVMAH